MSDSTESVDQPEPISSEPTSTGTTTSTSVPSEETSPSNSEQPSNKSNLANLNVDEDGIFKKFNELIDDEKFWKKVKEKEGVTLYEGSLF
jgi:hypothetical protein